MVEYGSLLTRLGGALAALDDDALAALANKGLVRRARKDLEQSPAEIVETGGDEVLVRVGGETVSVPANPIAARCSCPAGGVCRHVLAALIFLRETAAHSREEGASSPAVNSAAEVFAALDDDALQRWAGKALLRRAAKALAEGLKAEIDEGAAFLVRFPSRNIVCRFVPGAGLAGLICSCQAPDVCEHCVAAVLAWQAARGSRIITVEEAVLQAADDAPRTRDEVLSSTSDVLREMLSVGLARLSSATSQRLQTLAVSCHGVNLPRLERWLAALADETRLALRRDAQASATALLQQAARAAALSAALARPTARLVGQHRTRYEQVGKLSLIGLGAERWSSKSGYVGLTVYFWDESLGNWCSWSDARPLGAWGFDPLRRYRDYGPWDGCSSPALASRSRLQLAGAWRNPSGRLSGRSRTRATVVADSDPTQPPAISDWSQIGERARRLFGGDLGERSEQGELAILRPAMWLPGKYDEVRQELVRLVADDHGRLLPLTLRFVPETASAIQILEQRDVAGTHGLLGRLRMSGGRLWVEPISLLTDRGIINLTLDDAKPPPPATAPATGKPPETADEASEESVADSIDSDQAIVTGTSTPLGVLLSSVEAELERVAESGTSARRDLDPLRQAAARLNALGLESVGASVGQLVEKLRLSAQAIGVGQREEASAALLRAAYIVRLALIEESLTVATAGLA